MYHSLYLFPLLVGAIFMIAGVIMYKFPPKKINKIYGYRTRSAMKSQERWDFAQRHAAGELINSGFFLALLSYMGKFIEMDEMTQVSVGISFTILTILLIYNRVENALKDKFDKKTIKSKE